MARVKGELMQGGGSLGDQKLGCGTEHSRGLLAWAGLSKKHHFSRKLQRKLAYPCAPKNTGVGVTCAQGTGLEVRESHGLPSSPSTDGRAESGGCTWMSCPRLSHSSP